MIIKPLFESFKGMVSTSSLEEFHRTALSWLDQHCSLPVLRPSECGTAESGTSRPPLGSAEGRVDPTARSQARGPRTRKDPRPEKLLAPTWVPERLSAGLQSNQVQLSIY